MRQIQDKIFLDTNVLVYSTGEDSEKKRISIELINKNFTISTQVINEFINTRIRKFNDDKETAFSLAYEFLVNSSLVIIKPEIYKFTEQIFFRYGYSFYDSLIISAALESECTILYTEDLSHGQLIEKSLKIVNPFK